MKGVWERLHGENFVGDSGIVVALRESFLLDFRYLIIFYLFIVNRIFFNPFSLSKVSAKQRPVPALRVVSPNGQQCCTGDYAWNLGVQTL